MDIKIRKQACKHLKTAQFLVFIFFFPAAYAQFPILRRHPMNFIHQQLQILLLVVIPLIGRIPLVLSAGYQNGSITALG